METQDKFSQSFDQWINSFKSNDLYKKNFKSTILNIIKRNIFTFLLFIVILFPIIILYITDFIDIFYFKIMNISRDTFISFIGSYFGGFITFICVILTIRHSYNIQKRQENINEIKNECITLLNLIKNSNIPLFCSTKLSNFCTATSSKQEEEYLISMINNIYTYINTLQYTLIEAKLSIDIFDINEKCHSCKNTCTIYKIKKEFITIFNDYINKNSELLYNTINILQENLNIIKTNNIHIKSSKNLSDDKKLEQIQEIESKYNDIMNKIKGLNNEIIYSLDIYNKEYLPKITTLIKLYKYEKLKNI